MKPEVIGKKYDKVAQWWQKAHQDSTYGVPQIERAVRYCRNRRSALDVGCGCGGRIIRRLLETGFSVTGLDVSEKMLQLARAEHPEVPFELCDICKWTTDQKFDLIVAWDSIFHLPLAEQEPIVKKLCGLLQNEGILIYTFGDDYGEHEDLSFRDTDGRQFGELDNDTFGYGTIGINGNLKVLIENGCKCLHLEIDQYPANHVYVIARRTD
jgi:trans-aconitate methyltransferase